MELIMWLFLTAVGWLLTAWCAWCGWEWFALPLGAPVLQFWHVLGLRLLYGVWTLEVPSDEMIEAGTEKMLNKYAICTVTELLLLLGMWVAHKAM